MEINVQHDPDQKRFFANVSGEICELKYTKVSENTLDYYTTFVPHSLRGHGIAGKITAVALDYALAHKYYVVPSCPFVEKYIESHPQYERVLVQ